MSDTTGSQVASGSSERIGNVQYLRTVILFMAAGMLIGAATYVKFIPAGTRMVLKVGMLSVSLAAWMVLSRSRRFHTYKQLSQSFFAISLGVLLAQYAGNIPIRLLGFSINTMQGVAMAKFGEALMIVLPILVLHFATGGDRSGLFLARGNLKLGMITGIAGFAVFGAIALLQAAVSGLSFGKVVAALPWILVFIFSNAFMEELWFRALFLKKLEPLVGSKTALIITALVFAAVHISSTYVIDILLFMVALLALGLLWGWLMQKSNSIWGAVLIHAGADVLVILGFLAAAAH